LPGRRHNRSTPLAGLVKSLARGAQLGAVCAGASIGHGQDPLQGNFHVSYKRPGPSAASPCILIPMQVYQSLLPYAGDRTDYPARRCVKWRTINSYPLSLPLGSCWIWSMA